MPVPLLSIFGIRFNPTDLNPIMNSQPADLTPLEVETQVDQPSFVASEEMMKASREPARFVIFDLDNCLCDDAHRIPLIDWSQEDPDQRYADYHFHLTQDKPNHKAVDLWQTHWKHGVRIVVFTARPAQYMKASIAWIERHVGSLYHAEMIYMRDEGDHRPAVEVKRAMLDRFEKSGVYQPPYDTVVAAYDDHPDIVEMYKDELGADVGTLLKAHDVSAYSAREATRRAAERAEASPTPVPTPAPAPTGVVSAGILTEEEARDLENFGERGNLRLKTPTDHHTRSLLRMGMRPLPRLQDADEQAWVRELHADDGDEMAAMNGADWYEKGEWRQSVSQILQSAAETQASRDKDYGSAYKRQGLVMRGLFPNGLRVMAEKTPEEQEKAWQVLGVFFMLVSKMTRFAASLDEEREPHQDSAHDMIAYAAMLEELVQTPF